MTRLEREFRSGLFPSLITLLLLFLTACGTIGQIGTNNPDIENTPTVINTRPVVPVTGSTRTPVPATTVQENDPASQATAQVKEATGGGIETAAPPTATASTASPEPTSAFSPDIQIADQEVQNGNVTVDSVTSSGAGWLVIYSVVDGKPDKSLGYVPVQDGENKKVTIPINTKDATATMIALLHDDAGKEGTFEFPGPDEPVVNGLQIVSMQFANTAVQQSHETAHTTPGAQTTGTPAGTPQPSVTVIDQPIQNSMVLIPEAYSQGESWLVIHPQYPDGTYGNFIGFALLHDGVNSDIRIEIDQNRALTTLAAMLHVNASKAPVPQFPGVDVPITIDDKVVAPPFQIQGPVSGNVSLVVRGRNNEAATRLTDAYGMTLYINKNDPPGTSSCFGDCLGSFRPLLGNGEFLAGKGVDINKMGLIDLPTGRKQVTYDGKPLYYNIEDIQPGDRRELRTDSPWVVAVP